MTVKVAHDATLVHIGILLLKFLSLLPFVCVCVGGRIVYVQVYLSVCAQVCTRVKRPEADASCLP